MNLLTNQYIAKATQHIAELLLLCKYTHERACKGKGLWLLYHNLVCEKTLVVLRITSVQIINQTDYYLNDASCRGCKPLAFAFRLHFL